MQSLHWYVRRLRGMDPGEIAWRLRGLARDAADRGRIPLGAFPRGRFSKRFARSYSPAFRLSDLELGAWKNARVGTREFNWLHRLKERATPLVDHRFSFLGLENVNLGTPIDWHRDHASQRVAPRLLSSKIDYRDFAVTGDCKLVWEPNRHHQLVVLARAYRASGEQRFAAAVAEQLQSWIDANPFGYGMNWRSPLELAIRIINWTWAIDLVRESGAIDDRLAERLDDVAYLHLWDIQRKFSRGSSANNHLVGEAAGVFIASSYFGHFDRARQWRSDAQQILSDEIERQTYEDGCTREQALGYHLFVVQFYMLAVLVGRWSGAPFSDRYWRRLERMFEFLGLLAEGGSRLPLFGDADDGYVLDLGDRSDEARAWLAVAAGLFKRPDLPGCDRGQYEPVRWLLGAQAGDCLALRPPNRDVGLPTCAFAPSGYYLLQCGHRNGLDRISVLVDCGELGYQSIAAHGHADALSFTLRAFGEDVLVDPGTFDYFSQPEWREYFRSTRAHNTVTVDDEDQSVMLGPFMWGERASARCLSWDPVGRTLTAEHDGYSRLADPVRHQRTISLDDERRRLVLVDRLEAQGQHDYAIWFHFAASCEVEQTARTTFAIRLPAGSARIRLDPILSVQVYRGSNLPIAGWVSPSYHCKIPSVSLCGRVSRSGLAVLTCEIELDRP